MRINFFLFQNTLEVFNTCFDFLYDDSDVFAQLFNRYLLVGNTYLLCNLIEGIMCNTPYFSYVKTNLANVRSNSIISAIYPEVRTRVLEFLLPFINVRMAKAFASAAPIVVGVTGLELSHKNILTAVLIHLEYESCSFFKSLNCSSLLSHIIAKNIKGITNAVYKNQAISSELIANCIAMVLARTGVESIFELILGKSIHGVPGDSIEAQYYALCYVFYQPIFNVSKMIVQELISGHSYINKIFSAFSG